MGTMLYDGVIVIQIVRAPKAENWSGQEGGLSAQWSRG